MKRLFDIVLSAVSLLMLSPLLFIVAIFIKMESRGPVFFGQKRVGRGFLPFTLYTFRTAGEDMPREDDLMPEGAGAAVTKLGRLLRKTRIDELPQLWNVLKGDMSIVGPRPELEKYAYRYVDDYNEILKVRPGIIDMSSFACADEEALIADKENPDEYYTHVLQPEKIKLARSYLKRSSLLFDIELIGSTLIKLLYPHRVVTRAVEAILPYRRPVVISAELLICVIANYLAFFIRFDGNLPPLYLTLFLRYLPLLILLRALFLLLFSLDRGLWQYASIKDLFNIATAVSLGSLLFFVLLRYFFGETAYPRSIYMIDWLLTIFLLGGARLFWRFHRERNFSQGTKQRIIVFGAGNAADMFLRDIENSRLYSYEVIGLIDDNLRKKGLKIRGVPILGTRKDIATIVAREEPDEFLIAMPSASPQVMQEVVKEIRQHGLPVKTLPGLMGILSGRGAMDQIKVVEPEDVLFRPPAHEEGVDVKSLIQGKKVLITGAGGSIGSELSRQVATLEPEVLILFERHEESLFNLDRGLAYNRTAQVVPVIGDILNEERLMGVMERYRPEIVFHAAAYKHVPLMEANPYEAYRTNVVGSRMVAEAAKRYGVGKFVLISTDKAVNSVNVMGQTKRIAEEIVRHMSKEGSGTTNYLIVRFGNVLGSSGSVVPTFKDQIKRGGPVTVTHPEMTRFFMTIPEAVALVLQASAMGGGGDVFVLDMGEPVKILDLAKRMIGLYGLKVGKDIDIKVTGLRPGEKLFEELFNEDEKVKRTSHPKINMALANGRVNQNIREFLSEPDIARNGDEVRELLTRLAD